MKNKKSLFENLRILTKHEKKKGERIRKEIIGESQVLEMETREEGRREVETGEQRGRMVIVLLAGAAKFRMNMKTPPEERSFLPSLNIKAEHNYIKTRYTSSAAQTDHSLLFK